MSQYSKGPNAVLDYTFDWTAWLGTDTITTKTVAAAGATVMSSSIVGGTVVVWVAGGTTGTTATVACRITTAAGRTDERTIAIHLYDR